MRGKLPFIDILNWKGLFTKSSPDVVEAEQLTIAENCDFFSTYGALAKIRGNTRILATPYTELGSPKAITWIGFYKTSDLNGQILRHVLVAAGTTLARIDGSSLTTLLSGRTENLFHSATQFDPFLLISNINPALVGEGDELVKYDGAVISKWGLTAPGSEETVREPFDSAVSFTKSPASLDVTDDLITTWDGDAIRMDKTTTSDRIFSVEKAYDGFYVIADGRDSSKAIANRVNFFTYIPRGQLTADYLNSSTFDNNEAAMAVWVSPDPNSVTVNHWKFYIPIGQLVEGWNRLELDFSGAPVQERGSFYPETMPVRRIRWDFRLKQPSHTRTGIRLDRFLTLDEGAPVVTASGVGTISGEYSYKVTYISKYGHSSNAGPASVTVTASNNATLNLSKIPVSPDPQVLAREIYRTVAGGSIHLFLARINDNVTTTYFDDAPDIALGASTPPQAGDFSDDNSPPPRGGIVKKWKNTVFIAGDPQNPSTLYFSDADEPESFPLINEVVLDEKITAMYETYSTLIVETETGKWQVLGDNPDFSIDKLMHNMGCVGRRAAGESRLVGYAVDRDGMRTFNGNDHLKISEPIRDKYDELNKETIELTHTAHSRARNIVVQFNPNEDLPIPNYAENSAFGYIYSIDDINQGYWTTLELPANLNIISSVEIEDDNGDHRLYATSDDGMVFELFAEGATDWVDANGALSPVVTRFQTPYLRLGELGTESQGVSGRVEPQFVELRVQNNTNCTWNVTLESADGPSQEQARDSQDLDLEFGTNNSLMRYRVTSHFHSGDYIRLTISNSEQAVSCEVLGVRIYFKVHPFEGIKTAVQSV